MGGPASLPGFVGGEGDARPPESLFWMTAEGPPPQASGPRTANRLPATRCSAYPLGALTKLGEVRRFLVEVARQHTRVAHEAEDVAHDIVVAALRRGLPLDEDALIRSGRAAARLHSAFLARSAARRRARETCGWAELVSDDGIETRQNDAEPPSTVLSSALQTTLLLLVLGHTKAELRSLLCLTDVALRKRLQALRDRGPLARPSFPLPTQGTGYAQLRRTQLRLLPQLANRLAENGQAGRLVAAGDPDGHGFVFAEVLTNRLSTATPDAPTPKRRVRRKGNSCSTASSRTSGSSSS